jgi:hypothetical protein
MLQPPKPPYGRSSQKSAAAGPAPLSSLTDIADNRSLFIRAMPDPAKRRIAFDVVERNCRDRFHHGEEGLNLFLELVGYVQAARVDEAVTEFESRFLPMLDQAVLKRKLDESQ